jgi:hypothetical protein
VYVKSRPDEGQTKRDVLSCRRSVAGERCECVRGIVSSVGRSKLPVTVNFRKRKSSTIRLTCDGY